MYYMRRSPAGWLGFVMVLAGVFWLVADLAVSGLVIAVNVVDRYHFNITRPYEVIMSNHIIGPYSPGTVGTLWDIIYWSAEDKQSEWRSDRHLQQNEHRSFLSR
jgi:hypothetical protein